MGDPAQSGHLFASQRAANAALANDTGPASLRRLTIICWHRLHVHETKPSIDLFSPMVRAAP
jgi:hypothetical protein